MIKSVKNLRAIVTGGGSGIGFETSRQLLLKGAKAVAIIDVNPTNGAKAEKELKAEFGPNRSFFIQTDVSKPQEFEDNFNKAVKKLGGLDILVNNAGVVNEPKWDSVIDVNVKAVIQGTFLAIEVMGKHKGGKGGTVANTCSVCGFLPFKCLPTYCASKCAILGFSSSMALSYEDTGVAIKVMCPGPVTTDMLHSGTEKLLSMHQNEPPLSTNLAMSQSAASLGTQMVQLIEEMPNGTIMVCSTLAKYPVATAKIPDLNDIIAPI